MTWATASVGRHVAYVVLLEILLDTPVRVFAGVGTIEWGGHDWLGIGDLGEVSEITGGGDLDATEVTATMSGIDSAYRAELLNTISRGAEMAFYDGFINEATGEWSLEPELVYAGIVDHSEPNERIDDDGGASLGITLTFISAAAYARRYTTARRTDAHQQSLYAGDKGLEFLTDLTNPVPTIAGPVGGGRGNVGLRDPFQGRFRQLIR